MARACENLPEAKKARIDGLKQNFSIEVTVETQHVALMEEQRQLKPPVTHLVVRTHPELGRKSLHLRPPHSIVSQTCRRTKASPSSRNSKTGRAGPNSPICTSGASAMS